MTETLLEKDGILPNEKLHHVVILGGGFGGLLAAQRLRRAPVRITLIDKRNFHLFQPLLYQVATGGLSPGDIASPLRAVFKKQPNVTVLQAEAVDLRPQQRLLVLNEGELHYDTLIVATGVRHHYFGNRQWAQWAPGLKTVENALDMRQRIFRAFEEAEKESDPAKRRAWLRFIIVGGGPTGVELAGALGELSHSTLKKNFRRIDPAEAEILLLEGAPSLLGGYPPSLQEKAVASLERLGVTVRLNALVSGIDGAEISVKAGEEEEKLYSETVLWAAGVKANEFGQKIAERTGAETDPNGRIEVGTDCALPQYPEILIVGDLAYFPDGDGALPGVAQVAMQQGAYAAKLIRARLKGKALPPFRYRDKGSLAVIGRNKAVADLGFVRFSGFFAWLIWALVHIHYLIGFGNKALVSLQWAWNYLTRNRGARLITQVKPDSEF